MKTAVVKRAIWRGLSMPALLGLAMGGLLPQMAAAQSLQQVVLEALQNDPSMLANAASVAAADARVESARRQHWPSLNVTAAEPTNSQQSDFFYEDRLRTYGTVNVWAGGGIEAQVRGSKSAEDYTLGRSASLREDLAQRVAGLYLDGVTAQDELTLANINLRRHESLTRDLGIIAKNDVGRRSDLVQAESRLIQAQSRVALAETQRAVVQSRLARYVKGRTVAFEPVRMEPGMTRSDVLAAVQAQPEYQTQLAEVQRQKALLDVARSKRWPRVDLEQTFSDNPSARVLVNWSVANASTFSDVSAQSREVEAAEQQLKVVEAELTERISASRVSYEQALRRQQITEEQIAASQKVVGAFEEQFQIARRSLLDLLNAYAELAGVESTAGNARATERAAALEYLRAQGLTEAWVRHTYARSTALKSSNEP